MDRQNNTPDRRYNVMTLEDRSRIMLDNSGTTHYDGWRGQPIDGRPGPSEFDPRSIGRHLPRDITESHLDSENESIDEDHESSEFNPRGISRPSSRDITESNSGMDTPDSSDGCVSVLSIDEDDEDYCDCDGNLDEDEDEDENEGYHDGRDWCVSWWPMDEVDTDEDEDEDEGDYYGRGARVCCCGGLDEDEDDDDHLGYDDQGRST